MRAYCGFEPTTTLRIPSMGALRCPPEPPSAPSETLRARYRAMYAVIFDTGLFNTAFIKSLLSVSERECVTRLTPCGCPPTAIDVGSKAKSDILAGAIGAGSDASQFTRLNQSRISNASWNASPSSLGNKISTGSFG
jgi:hypothetical protein